MPPVRVARRLALLGPLLVTAPATALAPGSAPASIQTLSCSSSAASAPGLPGFDTSEAAPYFDATSPFARVVTALALDQAKAAHQACGLLEASRALRALPAAISLRGRFVCAIAALQTNDPRAALADLAAAGPGLPLLAPYVDLFRAQAELALGRADEALADSRAVPVGSPLTESAALLETDALRELGRHAEAIALLRTFLAAHSSSPRLPEAELDLATSLLHDRRPKSEVEPVLRAILVSSSLAPEAKRAEAMWRKITGRGPVYDAGELVIRGHALFDAMRNELAERTFQAALTAPGLTPELTCDARFHLAQSVFKERQRARSAPLFDLATAACQLAGNVDLAVRAEYQAGRGHAAAGDATGAISRFLDAAKAHPEHSYADDCLLRAAEIYDDQKDPADAEATLAEIPERFPDGDQASEALFRLAYRHYKKREWDAALHWLDADLARFPHETRYFAQGQALYWKARVLEGQGHAEIAASMYMQAAKAYPLSWYALLALNRLRELGPAREEALVASLRIPAVDREAEVPLRFPPSPLFATPAFERAVELIRLGLGKEARGELDAAGLSPAGPGQGARDRDELLWLVATLDDRAGDYAASHWIPKTLLTGWERDWPTAANSALWEIAFPRGYSALVEPWASKEGVPVPLEYAIIREESAFDPLCESFANAMGLTQQMMEGAKKIGRSLGFVVNRRTIFEPAINVPLGAAELGRLLGEYHGNVLLAVPAYNAGDGAVDRWLAEHGDEPLDEWAEEIPYDETRNYEKRVNASYFAYQFLYGEGDPVPLVPLTVTAIASR